MKSDKAHASWGFSLVETVLALGIFAFCIVAIMGLMPVGLSAARSVANEERSVSIAESIFAGWRMQSNKSEPLTLGGAQLLQEEGKNFLMIADAPGLTENAKEVFYFDSRGAQVQERDDAALRMDYNVVTESNVAIVELDFFWPAAAPSEVAQKRSFSASFQIPTNSTAP